MDYPKNTYFYYPKDKNNKALGQTVAIIIEDGKPFIGVANTSKEDRFVKKIGRQIALDRAKEQYNSYLKSKRISNDS